MDNYNLIEADDILDYFDIDQMREIIRDQITNSSDYSACGVVIDYLKPLYAKYYSIEPNMELGIDSIKYGDCTERFNVIVLMFAEAICNKFNINLDEFWLENASDDDKFVTILYLYTALVIDYKTLLTDICINYIEKNKEALGTMLNSDKSQKSGTYNAIEGYTGDSNLAIICDNVFDAMYYIFDTLNEDTVFDYTPEDYLPVNELKILVEKGILTGDLFSSILRDLKSNSTLRSAIAFDIISYVKIEYSKKDTE